MTGSEKQKLLILGAGLFAEEVAEWVSKTGDFELAGFVEGVNRDRCRGTVLRLPVIWIEDLVNIVASHRAVCAVGATERKGFIEQAVNLGLKFVTIAHPGAQISDTATLGRGTIVGPGVVVAAGTRVGSHVIINRGCLIGHHVEVGDYVTISPGVNIAGKARIGDLCYIGMGALILDGISVGSNSVVGAGSVVVEDVPSFVQVLGVPARISKEIAK